MKIVIDVPDSTYNDLRYTKQYNPRFLSDYEKIILSGTPLSEGYGVLNLRDLYTDIANIRLTKILYDKNDSISDNYLKFPVEIKNEVLDIINKYMEGLV